MPVVVDTKVLKWQGNRFKQIAEKTVKTAKPECLPVVPEVRTVDYDDDADVLYISYSDVPANDFYELDGIIVRVKRRWFKPPLVVGVTVMDASANPKTRRSIKEFRRQ